MNQKVDLHLVSWYRPKMTEIVIRAIHRNTKHENFRLVVLDNGSSPGTKKMLNNLFDNGLIDQLIHFPTNIGLEPARSHMVYEATYNPYFICVDNDCIPEPMVDGKDWIERLVDLMERYEDYAAIACRTQVMVGTGNIFEHTDQDGSEITEFPHPGGSLRLMRTKQIRDLGGWREKPGRGEEERFICGKLREEGFKTGFATNIRTLHLFGIRTPDKYGVEEGSTDRWGYSKWWRPAKSGHKNVHHPVLTNGDSFEEVAEYAGQELTEEYFKHVKRSNP